MLENNDSHLSTARRHKVLLLTHLVIWYCSNYDGSYCMLHSHPLLFELSYSGIYCFYECINM